MLLYSQIDSSWEKIFQNEYNKPYFLALKNFLIEQRKMWITIYPSQGNIFRAFALTAFDKVSVVILWQDPYHGVWQAHGLAFSVPEGCTLPPSLKNIYKEIYRSFPNNDADFFRVPMHDGCLIGDLTSRARNGVLLLNTVLTVEAGKAHSHRGKWREQFTDMVISKLSERQSGIVFLLRGNDARSKKSLIDCSKHYVIETTHPSPLSAYRGFLGSGCFEQTEKLMKK